MKSAPPRCGMTLIELILALGIGMGVVIGAFATVDAAAKVIGKARRNALEEDLVASVLGHLRHAPASHATPPGVAASGASDITATLFGVSDERYPEDWPRIWVERLHQEFFANGVVSEVYSIRLAFADGIQRPNIVVPIRRMP